MSIAAMPLGPVIAALGGLELTSADRQRLMHPLVGGVTLFSRNYANRDQLETLCAEIHAIRAPQLLICVDHEGGRVQRFRDGFTRLPPMRRLGQCWDHDRSAACALARAVGLVMAGELKACGVDLSFAPVLDVDHGASTIIGDRAFHTDPVAVAELAAALLDGMGEAGMLGVGKHFPGHGYIAADSHLELPVDSRAIADIRRCDLLPFRMLAPKLGGIMPAHVVYPAVDPRPAGFSRLWLREVLRSEIGFCGAIFSDDLGMKGAAGEGALAARALAAFAAGCDAVLACTAEDADRLLDTLSFVMSDESRTRLLRMYGPTGPSGGKVRVQVAKLERARASLSQLGV